MPMPAKVFISYARKDVAYKDEVVRQLAVLERQGLLSIWSDDRLTLGVDWYSNLQRELDSASMAVLLITANFLASDFILKEEVPRALELRQGKGLRLLPVLCRPCYWEGVEWLASIQIWPRTGQPLWTKETDDPAALLSDLAREVARLVGHPIPLMPAKASVSAVDLAIDSMSSSGEALGLREVAEIVRIAISIGAPIYNRGDVRNCAELYLHTVTRLAALANAAHSNFSAMPTARMAVRSRASRDPMLIPSNSNETLGENPLVLAAVQGEIMYGAHLDTSGAREDLDLIAWQLRHVFDRLLLLEGGIKLTSELSQSAVGDFRQFAAGALRRIEQISDACGLETTTDCGVGLFTAVVLGVLASQELLAVLRAENLHADAAMRRLDQVSVSGNRGAEGLAYVLWVVSRALRGVIAMK